MWRREREGQVPGRMSGWTGSRGSRVNCAFRCALGRSGLPARAAGRCRRGCTAGIGGGWSTSRSAGRGSWSSWSSAGSAVRRLDRRRRGRQPARPPPLHPRPAPRLRRRPRPARRPQVRREGLGVTVDQVKVVLARLAARRRRRVPAAASTGPDADASGGLTGRRRTHAATIGDRA